MTTVITVRRTDKPTPPTPQPTRNLYTVKRDQYSYSWNFQIRDVVRNGDLPDAPAVNRTGEISDPANFLRSSFTREWQFFWCHLLAMDRYGKLFHDLTGADRDYIVRAFNGLTLSDKYLTNRKGTDNCNNYITGKDDRGEDPKIDPLICADSVVEVLDARTSTSGQTSGLVMARLNTFRVDETPPLVTRSMVENDPRVLRATIIYPDGHTTPFPNFGGDPVPYPYISRHDCWFPLRDLEKI